MKNIKLFNIILAIIIMISACDSTYNDIYDEIDEQFVAEDSVALHYSDKTEAPSAYTLVDEDYTKLQSILLALGSSYEDAANDIGNYKNFSADVPASTYLPYLLDANYFSYTPGAEMIVTYAYYTSSSYEDVTDLDEYELENEDYDMFAGPGQYNNFSSSEPAADYIPLILAERYPLAVAGTQMMVQYAYYGGHYDLAAEFEFNGTVWAATGATSGLDMENSYELTTADYDSMGTGDDEPGEYDNFSYSVSLDDYVPDFLLTKYPSASTGDKQVIVYDYYGTRYDLYLGFTLSSTGTWTNTQSVEYNYDDGDYTVKTLSFTDDASSIFKFTTTDGWLYVPPLKFVETTEAYTRQYTLTDADYELVGNGKYGNFDVREGADEEDVAVRIDKISTILKANFNDLAVGDIFEVTYKVYTGSSDTWTINLEVVLDE